MSITANPSAPVSQTIVKGAAHSVPAVFPAQTTIQTTSDLGYAGIVSPTQAWELFQAGTAVIVDVRSKEELHFVGRVPGTLHVAWATGTALNRNPRFVRELEAKLNKSQTIFDFLIHSSKLPKNEKDLHENIDRLLSSFREIEPVDAFDFFEKIEDIRRPLKKSQNI